MDDTTIRSSTLSMHIFIPNTLSDAELDIQLKYRPIDYSEEVDLTHENGKLIFGVTHLDFCTCKYFSGRRKCNQS